MDFTLYSIGDAAFLEQILISIAMITGTGDFETMVSIGLLLGVIIVTVQSVFGGAKAINWQQVFLGWLVYGMFFFPTVTVNIEDIQRGEVRPVDNVPIGVGIAGGIISNIGYGLTELMEQAYSPIYPAMSENGYMEALQVLNQARRNGYNSSVIQAINASYGSGADFATSAKNYIAECTLKKMEMSNVNKESLFEQEILEAIQFNNNNYGTMIYLANPNGQNVSCSEGFALLSEALAKVIPGGEVDIRISQLLNLNTDLGESALRKVGNGLQALGLVSASASEYMQTAILEPLYYEAVYTRYSDLQDFNSAQMVAQAIAQRNVQWSAEHSLFLSVVDPVLAFFEGFIYGVTPIMAFIIMLGGMGITLAVKYFQVLIWVQLWYPILSITNLYLYVASSNELERVLDSKSITTMYGLNEAGDVLQSYIATGGMLAAATPMLALFIISGSTYTFNSLASRVNGADHINEKAMAPDMLQSGPLVKAAPMNTWDSHSGMTKSGTESLIGNIEAGKALQSAASSAEVTSREKTDEFSRSVQHAYNNTSNVSERDTQERAVARRLSVTNGETFNALNNQVKSFLRSRGLDEGRSEQIVGALAMNGGASGSLAMNGDASGPLSTGKAGLSGGVSGSTTTSDSISSSKNSRLAQQFAEQFGFDKSTHNALSNELAQSFSTNTASDISDTWGYGYSEQISESAKEATKASQQFTRLNQASQNVGVSYSAPANVVGAELLRQGLGGTIQEQLRFAPQHVRQNASDMENRFTQYMNMSPAVAKATAGILALANDGTSSINSFMSQATGANIAPQEVGSQFGTPRPSGSGNITPATSGSANNAPAASGSGNVLQVGTDGQPLAPAANNLNLEDMKNRQNHFEDDRLKRIGLGVKRRENFAEAPPGMLQEHERNTDSTLQAANEGVANSDSRAVAREELIRSKNDQKFLQNVGSTVREGWKDFSRSIGLKDQASAFETSQLSERLQEKFNLSPASADYVSAQVGGRDADVQEATGNLHQELRDDPLLYAAMVSRLDFAASSPTSFGEAIRPVMNYYGASTPFEQRD
ncbi:conjugal transfer protein TraG N-terminal domain-containing protein [Pseudovibrio sp. Ad37]|uniref:conjugal transfer protein TraG N-terminal domain-containing protein n=1 Tax=Pseudovibrio sp. Ad37 TaxID=989422 RepID=UPI0007AEA725|nr:conjugal transfer protein TraG N-terminal domain-containing protein [Pseudovibrio sp. Ad37]KZL24226.1 hypothetical protein PsAD37_02797 [Pseudovibrio sp. Ad37]